MQQELLPGHVPSEADMVQYALSQPLEKKIQRAIALLRNYASSAKARSEGGFYLAFSGGKDSCVLKQLAIEAGVEYKAFYNNTTIDPRSWCTTSGSITRRSSG